MTQSLRPHGAFRMSEPSSKLMQCSIEAALAAIEIYNKPTISYREQTFVVLITNAWELLFKAKLVRDADESLDAVHVFLPDGSPKVNRSGNNFTIDIFGAMRKLDLDPLLIENLRHLVDIRDCSVHLYDSRPLKYIVYTLGLAAIRNYQRLATRWFDRSLHEYNLFILPLAFEYNFETLSTLDLSGEPEEISRLLTSVVSLQPEATEGPYSLVCEIATNVVSAPRADRSQVPVRLTDDPAVAPTVIFKTQEVIDKYPLRYIDLWRKVKAEVPQVKQNTFHAVISRCKLKSNTRYAHPVFPNRAKKVKAEKLGHAPKGTAYIYNEDAVRLIVAQLLRSAQQETA